VRALAKLGRDILADEGRSVSDAIVERIGKTLDAAALDEGSRFLLRAGRLTEEVEPLGFDALAGMSGAPAKSRRTAAKPTPKPGAVAEARRRVQEAQRAARELTREAQRAGRDADRAEGAAAKARSDAREARERADAAEAAVADAEAALRDAQRG
jgi:chromosome segregation protein